MTTEAQIPPTRNPQHATRNEFAFFLLTFYFLKLINQFESIMQNKPNLLAPQMNATSFYTKDYENEPLRRCGQNKPNQTQFVVSKVEPPVVSLPNLFPHQKNPAATPFAAGLQKIYTQLPIYPNSQNAFYCVWYSLSDSSTILSSFFVLFLVFRGIFTAVPSRPSSPATSGWFGLS